MVSKTEIYKQLLQRAANAFEQLILLYASEAQAGREWAIATVSEAETKRNGYLERIANPILTAAYTGTFVSSIMRYLDEHWLDSTKWVQIDPAKAEQVDHIYRELKAIMSAIGPIHNELRSS